MKIVVGYCRVSTDEQAEEGVSLDAQRAKIEQWCTLNEHTLVAVESDEGISGKSVLNRPALQRALDRVCECGGVLLVHSLSRLSRSTLDNIAIAERLVKHGADLASCKEKIDTTTPSGRLYFTILAAFGQFEREEIADRTKTALQFKRSQGFVLGAVPYGCRRVDGKLEADPAEMDGIKLMLRMALSGSWEQRGYKAIAAALDAAGIKPRRSRWLRSHIMAAVRGSGPPEVIATVNQALEHGTINDALAAVRTTHPPPQAKWDRGIVRRIIQFYLRPENQRLIPLVEGLPQICNGAAPPSQGDEHGHQNVHGESRVDEKAAAVGRVPHG